MVRRSKMAKIKVYELAQEMGVKSSEILTILSDKGIEVKSHMSILEDGQVEEVKKSLKAPAKSDEIPKTTEKKETSEDAKASAKTGEAPAKKKKSIIFVSNPQNSKMPGAQVPKKQLNSDKKVTASATKPVAKTEENKNAAASAVVEKVAEPVK